MNQNLPKIIWREDPLVFISFFDMCEACEEFIEKFSHFPSVPQRTYQKNGLRPCSYKTLVGSFNPWLDSRDFSDFRNKDLLKVPLEFRNSILLKQDPALEQIVTKKQQLNIPTLPTSNPQTTQAPLPGNKRQRTTEQTPLQIPQTQQPSLLPTPKNQPINIPVTLPANPEDRPVVVDKNQRPIKKAKTSSPASSKTNAVSKSPANAPANTSTPASNAQNSSNNQGAPRPIQSGNNQPATNK